MASRVKHGEYIGGGESVEHYIWRGLFRRQFGRCGKYYTSITVDPDWREFSNFLRDMGRRPPGDYQIDRINTNGPYSKANCRWATRSVNQKNKKSTKFYVEKGVPGTLVEWAAALGISKQLALYRWKNWGTFERGRQWT